MRRIKREGGSMEKKGGGMNRKKRKERCEQEEKGSGVGVSRTKGEVVGV